MVTSESHIQFSNQQKIIINYDSGCVVGRACPGSGKTFSVAARIAKLLKEKDFSKTGIAAMSFTNVAGEEISKKLRESFNVYLPLQHPHFVGTIDKFINTYVFLPFGHLIMDCNTRPELVGAPHSFWTKGKGDRQINYVNGKPLCTSANPHGYFDSTSFDINDQLYSIVPAQDIHFSLKPDKYYNSNGRIKKRIQDLIDSKWENFGLGYANQADANYISLKVLEKYPLIAKSLAMKFQYFIVDEAQDTDAIQMKMIEILNASGANNIMLIGDRDQAIYEWNNADPALFDHKYAEWDKIELSENWRSSQRICNFTKPLSSFQSVLAVRPEVVHFDYQPVVRGYVKDNNTSMFPILNEFFATCEQNDLRINASKIAVLYRGKSMVQYLGNPQNQLGYGVVPWARNSYHVKDILLGKLLYELGNFKKGYRLIEKGYYETCFKIFNQDYHCNSTFIQTYIEEKGFTKQRSEVFDFINLLPVVKDQRLGIWITTANRNIAAAGINMRLLIDTQYRNLLISDIFANDIPSQEKHPFYQGTIHSVKGKTFDAVLLMLDKKAGTHSNYINILRNGPKLEEEEELRTVYVGLTRPTKVLMLAVPTTDVSHWKVKLNVL